MTQETRVPLVRGRPSTVRGTSTSTTAAAGGKAPCRVRGDDWTRLISPPFSTAQNDVEKHENCREPAVSGCQQPLVASGFSKNAGHSSPARHGVHATVAARSIISRAHRPVRHAPRRRYRRPGRRLSTGDGAVKHLLPSRAHDTTSEKRRRWSCLGITLCEKPGDGRGSGAVGSVASVHRR